VFPVTLITFTKPILFNIPAVSRERIIAQLLIEEFMWGTAYPIDDYGLYPVLAGDTLECLDYGELAQLYMGRRYLHLTDVTQTGEREYTLNIIEYQCKPSVWLAIRNGAEVDLTQYETVAYPIRYVAKHGEYELKKGDRRFVEK